MNRWRVGDDRESKETDGCPLTQDTGLAFDGDLDSEVNDFTIEKDDRVFIAMVHPVDPHHFVCALSTVSGRLAEVSAKNSKPKGFGDIVLMSLHTYANVTTHLSRHLYRNSLQLPPRTSQVGLRH
jgi:hypothetical protein